MRAIVIQMCLVGTAIPSKASGSGRMANRNTTTPAPLMRSGLFSVVEQPLNDGITRLEHTARTHGTGGKTNTNTRIIRILIGWVGGSLAAHCRSGTRSRNIRNIHSRNIHGRSGGETRRSPSRSGGETHSRSSGTGGSPSRSGGTGGSPSRSGGRTKEVPGKGNVSPGVPSF